MNARQQVTRGKWMLAVTLMFALLAAALAAQTNTLVLTWQYPAAGASDTNLSFNLYYTSNLLSPFAWLTNVPAISQTNISGTNTLYQQAVALTPGQYFFFVQATSSFWGSPMTSNIAWTPPAPLPFTNLAISKGQ